MFYNVVYRLPIWTNIDSKSRNLRLIVLGTILYIIVHSFIYSKYVDDYKIILENRKFLYYLIAIDLSIVVILMFLNFSISDNKKKNEKNKGKNKRKNNKRLSFNGNGFMPNMKMFPNLVNPIFYQDNSNSNLKEKENINNIKTNQTNNIIKNQNVIENKNQQTRETLETQKTQKTLDIESIKLPIYNSKKNQNDTEVSYRLPIYSSKIQKEDFDKISNDDIPLYKPNKI